MIVMSGQGADKKHVVSKILHVLSELKRTDSFIDKYRCMYSYQHCPAHQKCSTIFSDVEILQPNFRFDCWFDPITDGDYMLEAVKHSY